MTETEIKQLASEIGRAVAPTQFGQLLSYPDAAKYLGVGLSTLRLWVQMRRGFPQAKPIVDGGHPFFKRIDFEKWLERN